MKRIIIISTEVYRSRLFLCLGSLVSLVSRTEISGYYVRLYFSTDEAFNVFSAGLYDLDILHRCAIL